ncbi:YciI family protein [Solimonas sp. SE-A11]|uniref:YciI family protein n=1 Tax=Solimonas sp. SE-A11 TaxID=3054954 RepID=UPI00259CE12D|nr:YciI family protein [Solimonas sp. SE-A11]MDM4771302.1 YciI family protein [Solimonas sp. SE-A11]
MAHVLLIIEQPGWRQGRSAEQKQLHQQLMENFGGELQARGVLKAAESLLPTHRQALRIETRDGQRRQFDGPFAEAKEMIGGFFLLECSRDEALAIAQACPAAEWATVELRETGVCSES